MQQRTTRYEVKADRWEFGVLVAAYTAVVVTASVFVFLVFRAAHLIGRYQPGIDPFSYAESHVYIVLVEVVLWAVMARAAIRFKAYAWRIKRSHDGAGLNLIANAFLLSIAYAVLFDVATTLKTQFVGTRYLPIVATVMSLLPLAVFLLLSVLLYAGSYRLSRLVSGSRAFRLRHQRFTVLCLALFVLVVLPFGEYFYHVAPLLTDDDGLPHFALPADVLIGVYLVPFIAIWLLGLLSCLNLAKYAHQVAGKIYQPTFRNLYLGILLSYASTYLIQIFYVSNVPSNRFGFGLLFVLSLIVLLIVGYSLIYRGADRLFMLERGPTS